MFDQWHQWLGHPSAIVVNQVLYVCNVSISRNKIYSLCNAYALGKSHTLPFCSSTTTYFAPLELGFVDVWGPAPCYSDGHQYYIAFVDVYSRYIWV